MSVSQNRYLRGTEKSLETRHDSPDKSKRLIPLIAIARHKTIRQEIEKPYSQFYPSPYHEVQSSLGHPTLADMIVVGVKNKMKEARCRDIFEEVREHCGDLLLTDITDV